MKKVLLHFAVLTAVFLSLQWSCNKEDDETILETKSKLFAHNYVLVNTLDGSPAQVEVSYSVYTNLSGGNIVKKETLNTPFVIGGEQVMVKYDSLFTDYGGSQMFLNNKLRKEYSEKGADHLVIKNLSGAALHYAVVGNRKLTYFSENELKRNPEIGNKNQVDITKILKDYPQPIYKATPVLYLFKPELAPQTDVFVYWERIIGRNSYDYNAYVKKFQLKTPTFGELTLATPMSIPEVLDLYKDEFTNADKLFIDYAEYHANTLGAANRSLKPNYQNHLVKWYGTIPAGATFENNGQLWFVNTKDGDTGRTVFSNDAM